MGETYHKSHDLSSQEDRILEQAFKACGGLHKCLTCPDNAVCQRLADKLIGRVHLCTEARRGRG